MVDQALVANLSRLFSQNNPSKTVIITYKSDGYSSGTHVRMVCKELLFPYISALLYTRIYQLKNSLIEVRLFAQRYSGARKVTLQASIY